MKYGHVVRAIAGAPWAITSEKLAAIADLVAFKAAGGDLTPAEIQAVTGGARRGGATRGAGVLVLPLYGTIVQRANLFTETSGGTSTERFASDFQQAVADPSIAAIVIDVDSPGGMVAGTPELANIIFRARGSKPIVAVANTLMASAAYWIASAADEIVASPSAEVGSIGVIAGHESIARALEKQGVKVTLITAGKYKSEGSPYEDLSAEARAFLQSRVDELYDMFVGAVARHRGVSAAAVRSGYGQGRVLGAQGALRAGLIDRVATLQETTGRVGALAVNQRRARALDTERRRLRLEEYRTEIERAANAPTDEIRRLRLKLQEAAR